jgi:hypothetical protein
MDSFGNLYKVIVYIYLLDQKLLQYIHTCFLEPASLEKVAKQEEEQEAQVDEKITTIQNLTANGQETLLKPSGRLSIASNERSFRYDIMISYCHSDKELTYKIHKFLLDQGFKVWIDLDNMYGPGKTISNIFVDHFSSLFQQ